MTIGKAKFLFERWKNYMSSVSSLGVCYLVLRDLNVGLWVKLVIVVVGLGLSILFLLFVDLKHVVPGEYEYSSKVNPQWNELMKLQKK